MPPILGKAARGCLNGICKLKKAGTYVFSDQIGHLLRRAYQRHLAIFQANTADATLTSTQFVTLCAIQDNGPSSQTELTQATGIDQATIRGIIERLAKRELVVLQVDSADRRKTIVALTSAGRSVAEGMAPSAQAISELTMQGLNPAERVAIIFILRKMIEPVP